MGRAVRWRAKDGRIEPTLTPPGSPPTPHPPTRSTYKPHPAAYQLLSCRTAYRKQSFFPHTITEWNSLPAEVALSPTMEGFKSRIKPAHPAPPPSLPPFSTPSCQPTAPHPLLFLFPQAVHPGSQQAHPEVKLLPTPNYKFYTKMKMFNFKG
jgi:hypothetical protein